MHRILLALALLALLPAAAGAAFPGRNGGIVVSRHGTLLVGGEETGDYNAEHWAVLLRTRSGYWPETHSCTGDYGSNECAGSRFGALAVSPDGRRLVVATDDAMTIAAVGDYETQPLPLRGAAPAFSPTGTELAFVSGGSIWIGDVEGGEPRLLVAHGSAPAWSIRGWIAFVRGGAIYRIRPDKSERQRLVQFATAPEWSPDGKRLAFAAVRRERGAWTTLPGVRVADRNGRHVRVLEGPAARGVRPSDIAWSPNGHLLAVAAGRLVVLDLAGNAIKVRGENPHLHEIASELPYGHGFTSVDWRALPR